MANETGASPFPPHFDGRRFYNPGTPPPHGLRDALRWKLTSRPDRSPAFVADVEPSQPPRQVDGGALRVTLVNHSTVLVQHNGLNILTDPIWSARASPLSHLGPHRRRMPGVRIEDLPRIDAVLLSHNHYDHLDLPTLHRLARERPAPYIVPVGVGELLRSEGVGPVSELDWGDRHTIGSATISCAPAVHFSGRGLSDRNKTLWCGYVIDAGHGIIYYAGDTAFGNHFAQIRERFGEPRLSLLPIGAYEPRWFMSPVHMDPEQALAAHEILTSRASVAIHHGTFQLADDGIDKPPRELAAHSPPASFLVLRNGESAAID
jgi:L-ascorbate metabolism protein UlaG (beta-lactamase superfamily)